MFQTQTPAPMLQSAFYERIVQILDKFKNDRHSEGFYKEV